MYGDDVNPAEMHKTAVTESKVVERLYFWNAIYFITGPVLDFGIPNLVHHLAQCLDV